MAKLYSLNKRDFFNGLIVAVGGSIVTLLYGLTQQAGFNVFTAEWAAIGSQMISVGISAFMGYILKNFFSDSEGNLLGKVRIDE